MNDNNMQGRNQPVARTGSRPASSMPQQKKPEAAKTVPAVSSADVFKAVYKEQKLVQTEKQFAQQLEIQRQNDKQLYEKDAAVTVVSTQKTQVKEKEDKKFNIIFIILIILSVVLLAASVLFLVFGQQKNEPESNVQVIPSENTQSAVLESPFTYEPTYTVSFPEGIRDSYKNLYAQNQNFVGWLSIPGTCIDTPVYQCSNNEYYLKHDNFDNYTKYGIPFLDFNNTTKTLSRNSTIYGHNFDNELIFDELHNYTDLEFYKENPVIEFNTMYADYKWKVIAAFYTNGTSAGDNGYLFYYIAPEFGNNCMMEFHDELLQRSYIHTGVDVQPDDKLLTVTTCTYFFDRNGSLENARFAVVARLIRDGESEEVDVSLAKENDNIRFPQLYYDVFGGSNPWRNSSQWVPHEN